MPPVIAEARNSVWLLSALLVACGSRGPDVIFLPTATDVVTRMLGVARVSAADVVYDLGCGDGRIVIAAVKHHGARGVCVDIDPGRILASRQNADTAGVRDRIDFRQADLFEIDLEEATVIMLYLSPALNERLRPKLFRELQPGARVVSHNFAMGDWRPDTTVKVDWPTGTSSTVYGWVLPADVAGTWDLTLRSSEGERRYRVRFEQKYQNLSGTASAAGRSVILTAAHLVGDSLEFQLNERRDRRVIALQFTGRVSPNRLAGGVQAEGSGAASWQATRR